MNGSLSFISTDLENPLEVYDEMRHMFSGDFWKMKKQQPLVLIFSGNKLVYHQSFHITAGGSGGSLFLLPHHTWIWQCYAGTEAGIVHTTASPLNMYVHTHKPDEQQFWLLLINQITLIGELLQ